MSKAKIWLMPTGTRDSVCDLFEKGDVDAIKKLIEEGKLIPVDTDADVHTDSCGNFSHATLKIAD
jgi:hypothetical protein